MDESDGFGPVSNTGMVQMSNRPDSTPKHNKIKGKKVSVGFGNTPSKFN